MKRYYLFIRSTTSLLTIFFLLIIGFQIGKWGVVNSQEPGCNNKNDLGKQECRLTTNGYYIHVCRLINTVREGTSYRWVRTATVCTPPTATAMPTPTLYPTITPRPIPPLPPGIRWYKKGVIAMRCSTPDNIYRAEFNYDADFISLINGAYRSKFITTLTYTSHPSAVYRIEYGYARCACKEGGGMCQLNCNTGSQNCGICVPCSWHDGTANVWSQPQTCPKPTPPAWSNPLTVNFSGVYSTHEDIVEQKQHDDCGSFQTDLLQGSYQTDMMSPTRVTVNGIVMNCSVAPGTIVSWTLLYTDLDCTNPTKTPTPTPTLILTSPTPPPLTLTPTRVPTPIPTIPRVTPTLTNTPIPSRTPTPTPYKRTGYVGTQVRTTAGSNLVTIGTAGVPSAFRPYVRTLTLRQLYPNREPNAVEYAVNSGPISLYLTLNQTYRYEFCVVTYSEVKFCDTYLAVSGGIPPPTPTPTQYTPIVFTVGQPPYDQHYGVYITL